MSLVSDTVDDVATASNFREVQVCHYHLDFNVSFEKKEMKGAALLDFKTNKTASVVTLDVHETLKVHKVTKDGMELKFEVSPFTGYGSTLKVQLMESVSKDEEFRLQIEYTATGGPGVCWLEPAQTAGKVKPYVYTQGQAVMNRSFLPCQDTPAIKSTYSANIKVPKGFTAVMSASESSSYGEVANMSGDKDCYFFKLPIPIPSYLIALAVGDIQSADIGPRSRVWTEPCRLEDAKAEFGGVVEDFIATGEKLFGPYVWGRYDILVMPPSFPFGGMENPCLTFVTPCLLVGDKSMTDVVIHEISHSWFGNLVTNANWSEFWLNEGFTMFAQRCITEELFGTAYACLETATGLELLRQHIQNTGEDHPLNKLRVVIEPGVDPDDTYNETPYEKGFSFVSYLQELAGGKEVFGKFLKSYVDKFKYKSLVAEDTLRYYLEYFPGVRQQTLAGGEVVDREKHDFHDWLYKPGTPPYCPDLSAGRELTEPAESLAQFWIEKGGSEPPNVDISNWKTFQVLHFLDKGYPQISNTHNAEIRLRWSKLTIKNDYQEDFPNVEEFLKSQGKQKYTLPIYRALIKGSKEAKKFANEVFSKTCDQLHVNVQVYVQEIIRAG
ncbi:hypothetical protein ScPMuIL_010010 [Solemya velum]